jgi:MFS transporter, FSR family, fosmidomycin resistance protein
MTVAASAPSSPRRTLAVCGGAHALHDGFTDLLNVLYPLLQAQFGLGYAAVGALKALYSTAMAGGQIPSGMLARKYGGVRILAIGTLLVAAGYGLAGLSGSLAGVVVGLLLAGFGASAQHPIGSSLIASSFPGLRSRTALGTYNFTGDVGKVVLPALFALIATLAGWRHGLLVIAALAVVGAGVIVASLPTAGMTSKEKDGATIAGQDRPWAFWLLFAIHLADSSVRSGFLVFLPFLLRDKGADLPTIGLALSLVFAGGAAGKLVMGWVGQKLGVVLSVVATEAATTAAILALLPLSLGGALVLLPAVGVMLNGTSVLYGTIPEFVTAEKRTHAFAVFYTGGSAAGAIAPFLFGLLGDLVGLSPALVFVGCMALATVPMVWALRSAFRSTAAPSGAA